ncbi:MAG: hypothetical protein KDK39_02890 [Leptospiraceae bacterium]|nr:hypothetical protein [Leptospiraceae bacterium]
MIRNWHHRSRIALCLLLGGLMAGCAAYTAEPSLLAALLLNSDPRLPLKVTVSGISGTGLVLVNGSDTVTVNTAGIYQFPVRLAIGQTYNVTVSQHPASPTNLCTVSNGSGVMPADGVTAIAAQCGLAYRLGGSISGFAGGSDLGLLEANGSQSATITAGSSVWSFTIPYTDLYTYAVQIQTQSDSYSCSLNNAGGTIATADVSNVNVNCVSGTFGTGGTILTPPVFNPTPQVTTIAGDLPPGSSSGNTDGIGGAARFNGPDGITTDGTNIFISDNGNNRIRKLEIASATVSTIVTGTSNVTGMTTDGNRLYYAANEILYAYTIASGAVATLAGGNSGGGTVCAGSNTANCLEGTGTAAQFRHIQGITTDGTYIYVSDETSNRIRRVALASGLTDTFYGDGDTTLIQTPYGITNDGTYLYVGESNNNRIKKIHMTTAAALNLVATAFKPYGIVTDGTNLYISHALNARIYMYNSLSTGGTLSLIAGNGTNGYVDGDALTTARLHGPNHLTTDGNALYWSSYFRHAIRKLK